MRKLGTTAYRGRNVREAAGYIRGPLHPDLGDRLHVIWYDHFNKLRFTTKPNKPQNMFDNTTFALPEIPPVKPFSGYPLIQQVATGVPAVCDAIVRESESWPRLIAAVRALEESECRVPPDVRRADAVSPNWKPMAMGPWNSEGTGGLANIMVYLRQVRRSAGVRDIPNLVDINLRHHMLQVLYAHNHFQFDFLSYLANFPSCLVSGTPTSGT